VVKVLLCAAEEALGGGLTASLLARHGHHVDVRHVPSSLAVDASLGWAPDLLVVSAAMDDTAGMSLWRELQTFCTPRALVCFTSAADERREHVLRSGGVEVILVERHGELDIQPALLLIDRLISQHQREQQLDDDNRTLRALIDQSTDGIYTLKDNRFVTANRRFQEMVGHSLAELQADDFDIYSIVGSNSRSTVDERRQRLASGLTVEPRYEVDVQHKDGHQFSARVSVTYVDLGGRPGSLGIFTDVSDVRRYEHEMVRKNQALARLNQLASSVGEAIDLNDTLERGVHGMMSVLAAGAAGIALASTDRRRLELRSAAGIDLDLFQALSSLPMTTYVDDNQGQLRQLTPYLMNQVFATGELVVINDVRTDPRVQVGAFRDAGYGGAVVLPLRATVPDAGNSNEQAVVGAAFAAFPPEQSMEQLDRSLLLTLGHLLGNAIDKSRLLEAERRAVRQLRALDELALTTASTLDLDGIELGVARQIQRLFGATRVMMLRIADPADVTGLRGPVMLPTYVLDDGEPQRGGPPISARDSIIGLSLLERKPMQRTRPMPGELEFEASLGVPVDNYDDEMFRTGVGTAVAVPLFVDAEPVGAIWLGYASIDQLSEDDLQVLSAIGGHVGIATKNARLFEAKRQAMADLQTAQDQLVEAEKLNAIGMIAHGVAHDFNNVLSSILGRAQLLSAHLHEPALLRHVEIIEKSATDGAETVRRIQEIGRQRTDDDFVAIDMHGIMTDVIEMTEARCRDGHVEVHCDEPAALMRVAGNASELREVLINLVHNAVDAMAAVPTRERSLQVRWLHDDEQVTLQLIDSGTGIADDVLDRIFDPYFTTKGKQGTGLGLSVSQSIVHRHNGRLAVASRTAGHRRGTTFSMSMPRLRTSALREPAAMAPPSLDRRIMIIDDEENIRDILGEMLISAGHQVVAAQDGAEALHMLQQDNSIAVLFTDLSLPGMSGFEVAQEAKRLRPSLRIGLVTGWGATLDDVQARQQGVDRVLAKPFRFDEILAFAAETTDPEGEP
jgi:PAS domain S-box-containing protein